MAGAAQPKLVMGAIESIKARTFARTKSDPLVGMVR